MRIEMNDKNTRIDHERGTLHMDEIIGIGFIGLVAYIGLGWLGIIAVVAGLLIAEVV